MCFIISSRIAKPANGEKKLSKTKQRYRLAALIEELGFDVMPYSTCYKRGWKCRIMEGTSKYKECTRRGRPCNGTGVPASSLSRVVDKSQRLRRKEKETSELLKSLHKQTAAALAKLERLRT